MSAIKTTLEWHLNKEIGVVVVAYRAGNWCASAWNSCAFGECAWCVNAFTLQIYISHIVTPSIWIFTSMQIYYSVWKCCKFMSVSHCGCGVSHYRLCLWGNPRKLKCFIVYPSLNICVPFDASLLLFPDTTWPILSETQCVVHFPNWRLVKALTLPLALIKIIALALLVLLLILPPLSLKHKDLLKVRLLLANIIIPSCSSRRAVPLYLDCLQLSNQGKP